MQVRHVEVAATFVDSLKCAAPAREDTVQVALVRTLGQDFGPDCASFGYYRPPTLVALACPVDKDEATCSALAAPTSPPRRANAYIDAEEEAWTRRRR